MLNIVSMTVRPCMNSLKYSCSIILRNSVLNSSAAYNLRIYPRNYWTLCNNTIGVNSFFMDLHGTCLKHCVLSADSRTLSPCDLCDEIWMIHSRNFSKKPDYPVLNEDDLEESFARGSGPGGQSVNKTTNCVHLRHKVTGIVVKNHESRSLDTNRKKARLKMQEKLDIFYNGMDSFVMRQNSEALQKRKDRKKRTNKKLEKLKAFREREGLS